MGLTPPKGFEGTECPTTKDRHAFTSGPQYALGMRYLLLVLACWLSGCDSADGTLTSTTVPEAGMLVTPEGQEIVAWFRTAWPAMPADHMYFKEYAPLPGKKFPPGYRAIEAVQARPDVNDSKVLNIGLKYTVVVKDGASPALGESGYDPYLPFPRSEVSPTIASWQNPRLPDELRELRPSE